MICDKQNVVDGKFIDGARRFRVVLFSGGYSDFLASDECEVQPSNLPETFRRAMRGAEQEIVATQERDELRTPQTNDQKEAMRAWLRDFVRDIPIGVLKTESLNG